MLDFACGCGYGAKILSDAGNCVVAVDGELEAIRYGAEHYPGPGYLCVRAEDIKPCTFDVLVTLETLEHLSDPAEFLSRVKGKLLIASVPNEERYPFRAETFAGDDYPHKRHYTPGEFDALLTDAGYTVTERACQTSKHGEVVPGTDGMFLVYVAHGSG